MHNSANKNNKKDLGAIIDQEETSYGRVCTVSAHDGLPKDLFLSLIKQVVQRGGGFVCMYIYMYVVKNSHFLPRKLLEMIIFSIIRFINIERKKEKKKKKSPLSTNWRLTDFIS